MHTGAEIALRQMMFHAKPWQRAMISALVVAGGVVLLILGNWTGLVVIAVGVVFALSTLSGSTRVRDRGGRRRSRRAS
ncbi:MAG: hypothetical protein KGI65_01040 [Acidobacteriota bacterium]|nr:hypothetical protein [Acidobacteriota bacterium]MDE3030186.1 hypothetical protein [Acidobacteriota bacterium]MDE3138824.1 hypothetical protein [Acidobacteriota bacterium]